MAAAESLDIFSGDDETSDMTEVPPVSDDGEDASQSILTTGGGASSSRRQQGQGTSANSAVGGVETAQKTSTSTAQDPWPYLHEFFLFKSATEGVNGLKVEYKCKLCPGERPKIVAVHTSSRANLARHVAKFHPTKKADLEELMAVNTMKRGRRNKNMPKVAEDEQQPISHFFSPSGSSTSKVSWVPQLNVDQAVLRFIVETFQPFHVVEEESFINLVQTLQPSKEVMSRNKLRTRLRTKYLEMRASIKSELQEAEHVSATADIWTGGNRAFLGLTAHILTPKLGQRSFAIACKRMTGRHTHDIIAKELLNILKDWGIQFKTVGLCTDNASNFVKAFKLYGTQAEGTQARGAQEDEPEESQGILF